MMHVHRPPTRIVATTLANNDAMLRCDLGDFMPDLPKIDQRLRQGGAAVARGRTVCGPR